MRLVLRTLAGALLLLALLPPAPAAAEGEPATVVTVSASANGDRYTISITAQISSPGEPGKPKPKPEPPKPPGPPSNDPKLPRTTYFTNTVDGEIQYCVRREEERRPGDWWAYWYVLCTSSTEGLPPEEIAAHPNDRFHILVTNIPQYIYYTPCHGSDGLCAHVIPYTRALWVPKQYPREKIDVRGGPISAIDAQQAALSVLANVPLPEVTLRSNPDLGLVNVPTWFWVEGYDGGALNHRETVFLSAPNTPSPGDCSPLLPIQDMRTNLEKPLGVGEILDAVFGGPGSAPPILWGWGYSNMDGHGPYLGYAHFHTGVDLVAAQGTALYAPTDGVARQETWKNGTKVVYLTLPTGHTYRYLHLSSMVASGSIRAGDLIGYVGSTGYSFQPHLHLDMLPPGVITGGSYVPPEHWSCLGGGGGLSVDVAVSISAARYEWDFGDGTVLLGSLGKPYPLESDVRHTYTYSSLAASNGSDEDAFPTQLTIQFAGTYTVDDGSPQELPPLDVTYDNSYRVQEAQSVLTQP